MAADAVGILGDGVEHVLGIGAVGQERRLPRTGIAIAVGGAGVVAVHIAVENAGDHVAVVHAARQQDVLAEELAALEVEQRELVLGDVRRGIDLVQIVEKRQRQGLVALQRVVGQRERQVDVGIVILEPGLGKQLLHFAGVVVGPAGIAIEVRGDEVVDGLTVPAGLEFELPAARRAAVHRKLGARELEAALGHHRQRAAQRVQTELRIGARHQRDVGNRVLWNQIPVDHIAEGLVDAYTIDEHRQSLRRAQIRRSLEAAHIDVDLVGIALGVVDVDAAQRAAQRLAQIVVAAPRQVTAVERLHIGGHLLERDAGAGQRGGADHLDGRQLIAGARIGHGTRFHMIRILRQLGCARAGRQACRQRGRPHACNIPLVHRPPPSSP